ncbi:hypothetical protein KR009_009942 [Drosophila setifemur]|nr:hypothetical protein KR009_009942 [Drosophila setifemur]
MLPMSAASAEVKQLQQTKRELSITTTTTKSSGVSGGSGSQGNSLLTLAPRKDELRFLPLSASNNKSCNITIGNIQSGNQNQLPSALKSKLTSMNIVPKPLKSGGGGGTASQVAGSASLFQLLPAANSNPNQPLVAILTGKTAVIGGSSQHSSNSQPVMIRPAPAGFSKGNFTLHSNGMTPPVGLNPGGVLGKAEPVQKSANAAASGPGSGSVLPTLPVQAANSAPAQISLLANPLKPRAPLILSKVAVDKLRLKFNQAKANPNSIMLGKSENLKKILPMPAGSEDKARTSQNNNKAAVPIKAMPLMSDNTNSRSIIKPKQVMKAVPLPTKAIPVAPAPVPVPTAPAPAAVAASPTVPAPVAPSEKVQIEKESNPKAKSKLQAHPILEIALNGPLKKRKDLPKPQNIRRNEPPKLQSPENKETSKWQPQESPDDSPKLQRSKSFVGIEQTSPLGSERRHSVAIMAKEVDVIEQPSAPIETITIEDDDESEEEEVLPQPPRKEIVLPILPAGITISTTSRARAPPSRKSSSVTTLSSRKSSSTSSNSDVEEICVPVKRLKEELSLLPGISIVKAESLPVTKEDFERSLRCDEQVPSTPPSSSSSASVTSDTVSPPKFTESTLTRIAKNGEHRSQAAYSQMMAQQPSSRANALRKSMFQNLSMLKWRGQQPANLPNSSMRFELNEFGLLQLNERCEQRQGPANYFERSLYDRPERRPSESIHPLLYLCQRCNCHGPAADFLAPHYCSLHCVRRAQKRRLPPSSQTESKMSRIQVESPAPTISAPAASAPNNPPSNQKALAKSLDAIHEKLQRPKEKVRKPFRWSEYLKAKGRDAAAPIHLFLNPFPISPNGFERGMKLEAIDPENCSLFCVCTIAEVRGYRLKLSFDGYSSMYDFWVNADSQDIFPPGWCDETLRVLQAPNGYCSERFSWSRYLVKTGVKAAPRALFTHLNMTPQTGIRNGFVVGMRLEAEDLNDTGKICVATVADILDERIRVHFDGWDDCYDLWVHISSPYIHPCGWHEGRQQLIVPPDYQKSVFSWPDYIAESGGLAAPKALFTPRQPMEYQARMKLEVVDQRNPCLIRPATVVTRKGYRVQLHLDCWPQEYYFWLEDDSPDLHPIGWCEATSHDLETPPGYLQPKALMPCDVEGCRGYGNAKRFNLNVHALRDCCPYAPENWRQWRSKTVKPARVSPENIWRGSEKKTKRNSPESIKEETRPEVSLLKVDIKPESKKKVPSRKEKKETNHKKQQEEPKEKKQLKELDARSLAIAKTFVKDYGPQFLQNYRLWQQNSTFQLDQVRSNPLNWTNWDVFEFVERALDSTLVARMLFDQDIDGRALLMLGRQELDTYLKLKVGPAVKLFSLIVNLRIAVVSKFETDATGLEISSIPGMQRNAKKMALPPIPEAKEMVKMNGFKLEPSHHREPSESGEEDDEMLDSDDFLSVKHYGLGNDEDSDVVMVPLETRRPMTTAS